MSIRLFVGYDTDEPVGFHVFSHSVHRRASVPVSVHPLVLSQLKGIFDRPRDPKQSTEFAFTRFLVPFLCRYEGWAMFADGDMLCRADLAELWAMRHTRRAVMVVQRGEQPTEDTKFLGRLQTSYRRKNWSSVMLLNCAKLWWWTPDYVRTASGLDLHQFTGVDDDNIGALPPSWNHLVGVDPKNPNAKIVHFTLGLPVWLNTAYCEYSYEWRQERDAMLHAKGTTPRVQEVECE